MTLGPRLVWLSELILRDEISMSNLLEEPESQQFVNAGHRMLAIALTSRTFCVDDMFDDNGSRERTGRCVVSGAQAVLRRRALKPRKAFRDKAENWPPTSWSRLDGSLRCMQIPNSK